MDANREASRQRLRRDSADHDSLDDEALPDYKPASLQLPFLIFLAVYICALIALLEYGFHTLPSSNDSAAVPQDESNEVFIYGPLIHVRRKALTTYQTLPTAQATPGRLPPSKSRAHGLQKFPRWASGNGSDLGAAANTTATSVRPTSVSGVAPTVTQSSGLSGSSTPSLNSNGSFFFANRSGSLWHGPLNETWLLNGTLLPSGSGPLNKTRRVRRRHNHPKGVQERDQDPGNYAQPIPSLRKLYLDFHYLSVGGRTIGQSLVRYQSYNDDSSGLYRAACVGPAIVFFDIEGWGAWQYLASYEKQWREGPHGADWEPLEISDGADKCSLLQAGGGLSSQGPTGEAGATAAPATTVPAEVIVVTDSAGHPVASSTRLLSSGPAQITTETVRDSQGRPTRTVVEAVDIVTTLRDAAGRPTATITTEVPLDATFATLTDSMGVPTATVELVTLRDSNGVPTATEELELDSRGTPTATDELELVTLRNKLGVPTATVEFELKTLRNAQGIPTATIELELLTLRNAEGQPTATVTSSIGVVTGSFDDIVLTDSDGSPVATVDTDDSPASLIPGAVTLTDSNGIPTDTATGYYVYTTSVVVATSTPMAPPELCDEGNKTIGCVSPSSFHPITVSEYAAGFYVPVLLGLTVSLLAKLISSDIKMLLPFQALTWPGGAAAANSLVMEVGGIEGLVNSWKLLWKFREPVSLLSDILLTTSTVVVALSSGSFGAKLYGSCAPDDFNGCFMGLALYTGPSRAIQALLAFMLLIIILLCVCLRRWTSGVAAPPTSMAVLGSLLPRETSKDIFQNIKFGSSKPRRHMNKLDHELKDYIFSLRYFRSHRGAHRYGIVVQSTPAPRIETRPQPRSESARASDPMSRGLISGTPGSYKPGYFTNLSLTHLGVRVAFLLIISGFLALILYYKSTRLQTPFERFMDNQNFGVRILFTSLGLVISSFWQYQFSWVSVMEPYRRLSQRPQIARNSIYVWPPNNIFVGFAEAVWRGELVAALVAFASILSQFTPILLSNIPFSPLQTWTLHLVCAWMVVAILGFMILVLLLQSATKYPYLPVDPRVLAGKLYYLADSAMLDEFRGTSLLTRKELIRRQTDRKTKYSFGSMIGVSGRVRIGVDYAEQVREVKGGAGGRER